MNTADCFATIERRFRSPEIDWYYENPIALYGLVRVLQPATVVEVGTYKGLAACYLARALQENNCGHLYCIDSWASPDLRDRPAAAARIWEENLEAAGVRAWATLLVGESDRIEWPARVDFAYIDGDHAYAACKRDSERALALGAELIALDDVTFLVGPRAFVNECRADPGLDVLTLARHGGLTLIQPRRDLGPVRYSMENPEEHRNLTELSAAERKAYFRRLRQETGQQYPGVE